MKLECLQLAGSFKVRGVLNKLAMMGETERKRGVVTVSGGNHAIAVNANLKLQQRAHDVVTTHRRGVHVVTAPDARPGPGP